jgi:hypothetical protein
MNYRLLPSFSIVEASTVDSNLPCTLSALLVGQRDVNGPHLTKQRDGADLLFAEVAKALASAGITFGNLESPFAGELCIREKFAAQPLEAAKACALKAVKLVTEARCVEQSNVST